MPSHVVEQGECLSSIAARYGMGWKKVYDAPENADLRRARPDPNVIYPGDEVFIPEKVEKMKACATEQRHRFKLKRVKTLLRIKLLDCEREPLAGRKYKLSVEGVEHEGKTDDQGMLEAEIGAGDESGELVVVLDEGPPQVKQVWPLRIGHLDPVEEVAGAQGRLNNLGYDCGEVDGIFGPLTESAVERYQADHDLSVDGVAGPRTQKSLKEAHGC